MHSRLCRVQPLKLMEWLGYEESEGVEQCDRLASTLIESTAVARFLRGAKGGKAADLEFEPCFQISTTPVRLPAVMVKSFQHVGSATGLRSSLIYIWELALMHKHRSCFALLCTLLLSVSLRAEVRVAWEGARESSDFRFSKVAAPAIDDAAAGAALSLLDGRVDENSGSLAVLTNGGVPSEANEPRANFFFNAGSDGGLIEIDLRKSIDVSQVATYSWHTDTRAAQVYRLYGANEQSDGLKRSVKKGSAFELNGWSLIAEVDTRGRELGGQFGVSISDSVASLGRYRYLLLDVEPTEKDDPFGNTFFSEIDVIEADAPPPKRLIPATTSLIEFASKDGLYRYSIDVTKALDLAEWSDLKLRPVVEEWYPKIVELFPSREFKAASTVKLRYLPDSQMQGIPAYANGALVTLNADWFRKQLNREARGAVVHELVHVVQAYSSGRRGGKRTPSWITEGLPDYVRWFLYEPETGGAEINARSLANARYNASYRVSGNFFDWVAREYGQQVLVDLNAVARQGMYEPSFWKDKTGATEEELDRLWRAHHQQRIEKDGK